MEYKVEDKDCFINIKVPKKLYNDIKDKATDKNLSLASLVRLVMTDFLKKEKQDDNNM